MHIYYHSCSFVTMGKDIREAGIRRYVRYFLEITLQNIFRNSLVHLEEEYLLSPYFCGGMLLDTRRRNRRPFAERTNLIRDFSRYCVRLLQTISDAVSIPLIDAFARYNYASKADRSILNHIIRIDTDNDVQCRGCEVGENRSGVDYGDYHHGSDDENDDEI